MAAEKELADCVPCFGVITWMKGKGGLKVYGDDRTVLLGTYLLLDIDGSSNAREWAAVYSPNKLETEIQKAED